MSYTMKTSQNFSHSKDLKLIRLVQENPLLYDPTHERHLDSNSKEVTWQMIGDELQRPAAQCKMRWVNIRDSHRRLIRKKIKNPGKKLAPYKYQHVLQFIRPHYKDLIYIPDNETENTEEVGDYTVYEESNDNNYESDNAEDEPINTIIVKQEKNPKKRKKTEIVEVPFEAVHESTDLAFSDPVDTFLKTIGVTLKTLSPYRLNLAKTQIFSIVQEQDLQQIMQNQKVISDNGESLQENS